MMVPASAATGLDDPGTIVSVFALKSNETRCDRSEFDPQDAVRPDPRSLKHGRVDRFYPDPAHLQQGNDSGADGGRPGDAVQSHGAAPFQHQRGGQFIGDGRPIRGGVDQEAVGTLAGDLHRDRHPVVRIGLEGEFVVGRRLVSFAGDVRNGIEGR